MKRFLAIFLSICIIASMLVLSVSAESMSVSVSGKKTDSEALFTVELENIAEEDSEVFVYLATFEADGSFKNLEKYEVWVEKESRAFRTYLADITDGDARIFVWDTGMKPSGRLDSDECELVSGFTGEKIEIASDNVWASNIEDESNPAMNAVDGEALTKWSATDEGDYITLYLGKDFIVSDMDITFAGESDYNFTISLSEDGENFFSVSENVSDGGFFTGPIANVRAKYVRVTLDGMGSGTMEGISEIEVSGFTDNEGEMLMSGTDFEDDWQISAMDEMNFTDYHPSLGAELYVESGTDGLVFYDNVGRDGVVDGEELEITKLTASQEPESNNSASNAIDSDSSTIWTASGVTDSAPATLVADLGGSYTLSSIGVAFDLGASRTYNYSVAISSDNVNYTTVVEKTTAKNTNDLQKMYLDGAEARYVKYTFYARSDSANNGWIRISEVKAFGGEGLVEGAGGVLAQKSLSLPENRGDYEITFEINMPSEIGGEEANAFYSGVSLTDGIITGGADLDNYAAVQIRFDNSGDKIKINQMISNYFNEGSPIELFKNTFNKDENISVSMLVSPSDRTCMVTVSDSQVSETRLVYFSYADVELTRNSSWTWLEANTLVFNTGAGSKNSMTVKNLSLREVERNNDPLTGAEPTNGIIRLEATRLSSYPTSSGDYYGRYVYHSGGDGVIKVQADKNPALTRFVERRGLVGCGVSLESVTMPGYFVVAEMGDAFYLKKLENTGDFYARATFFKEEAENVGYYTGSTYTYRAYLKAVNSDGTAMEDKYLYDTTSDYISGDVKPWKIWAKAQATFYLRNEGTAYASDNFYGNSISSQWWTNYPWKSNNPTNDSYNFTALITKNNVIVSGGELLLKATKIDSNAWPTDANGETGKQYNGDFGRTDWKKWQAYVGVVSIEDKVYNKQCFVEGRFKDPDSPIGYWNAFWLTGRDSWPPEIDIFETLSSKYGHYAWHTALHGEGDSDNRFGKITSSTNIATSYNTWSMDWGYDYIKFYLNGNLYASTQNDTSLAFQKNMRLILNTGIGGWESEPDDTTVWDDGLRCQWIRSFQY